MTASSARPCWRCRRRGSARHGTRRRAACWSCGSSGLAAERAQQLWADQLGLAEANPAAVERLRRAGDASMLEQNTAGADLAEVQRQLSRRRDAAAKARARLLARFPQVVLQPVALGEPLPLVPDAALWRQRILAESDVVRIARRACAAPNWPPPAPVPSACPTPPLACTPHPRGRWCRTHRWCQLSIPLGGTYRGAQRREALKLVEAARATVDVRRGEIEAEIGANLADAGAVWSAGSLPSRQRTRPATTPG